MAAMDEAAGRGMVALQRCGACGAGQYPPREACRACLSDGLEWREAARVAGEVVAVAEVAHSFDPGFAGRLPVRVGLVRIGDVTVVCFVPEAGPGPVWVRAGVDGAGRAVLEAGDAGAGMA